MTRWRATQEPPASSSQKASDPLDAKEVMKILKLFSSIGGLHSKMNFMFTCITGSLVPTGFKLKWSEQTGFRCSELQDSTSQRLLDTSLDLQRLVLKASLAKFQATLDYLFSLQSRMPSFYWSKGMKNYQFIFSQSTRKHQKKLSALLPGTVLKQWFPSLNLASKLVCAIPRDLEGILALKEAGHNDATQEVIPATVSQVSLLEAVNDATQEVIPVPESLTTAPNVSTTINVVDKRHFGSTRSDSTTQVFLLDASYNDATQEVISGTAAQVSLLGDATQEVTQQTTILDASLHNDATQEVILQTVLLDDSAHNDATQEVIQKVQESLTTAPIVSATINVADKRHFGCTRSDSQAPIDPVSQVSLLDASAQESLTTAPIVSATINVANKRHIGCTRSDSQVPTERPVEFNRLVFSPQMIKPVYYDPASFKPICIDGVQVPESLIELASLSPSFCPSPTVFQPPNGQLLHEHLVEFKRVFSWS